MSLTGTLILIGFSTDDTLIVRDMKYADRKKPQYQIIIPGNIAAKIADNKLTLPAVLGDKLVSIFLIRRDNGMLQYTAQIVNRLSSDKMVFEEGQIVLSEAGVAKDLKKVNCDYRMKQSRRIRREEINLREQQTITTRQAISELKEGGFRIRKVNLDRIAAKLS